MAGHDGRQLASKWAKTEALLSNSVIASHIPQTSMFSAENLRSMLDRHGMVVVKPVVGSGGYGVMKVARNRDGGYTYTYLSNTTTRSSYEALVQALKRKMGSRRYMIQKGIHLATVNGRPIDYRVKYVKTGGRWEYRSLVGRIARPGLFVTNLSKGGTMVTAAQGIRASLSSRLVAEKKRKMRELTVLSTQVLETRFPGISQLGFDYGIDRQGKIWIFEVNTRPH